MEYESKVRFVITDFDCESGDITNILDFRPTNVWRKGDYVHPKAKNKRKENGWELVFCKEGVELQSQLIEALNFIGNRGENIKHLPANVSMELSIVVYAGGDIPGFHFDSSDIKYMGEMGIDLDVDLYLT